MNKGSHCLTQIGPPNPFEECMSQFLDTKVESQRCYMELFDKKLMESTALGGQIWSTPSELWCITRGTPAQCVTQNCGSVDHSMCKEWVISLSEISCYAFEKRCRNYSSIKMVLHAPVCHSIDSCVATAREALPMLKWYPQI